jgi:hypothetical protein
MQAKTIHRNATRQQATIFSQIKSAQLLSHHYDYVRQELTEFDCIENNYREYPKATLTQHSEHEFTLSINSQNWINFSTKEVETIVPATTEVTQETVEAIAPVESTSVEEVKPVATEVNNEQPTEPAKEVESLELQLASELKSMQDYSDKAEELTAKLEKLQAALNNKINEARQSAAKSAVKATKLKHEIAVAQKKKDQDEKPKAKLLRVKLSRFEGLKHECKSAIAANWESANRMLRAWAETAPNDGSYHKCQVKVSFSDGDSLEMRLDLVQQDSYSLHLPRTIKEHIAFRTGDACPDHMPRAKYENYLKTFKVDTVGYKRLFDTWDLPA